MVYRQRLLRRREMLSSLHPYRYWKEDSYYLFDTPSGAQYVAYFLELDISQNLFTFNFDKKTEGNRKIANEHVFDTICSFLLSFFVKHENSLLVVCDSSDGRENARMRLFARWYNKMRISGVKRIDRIGRTKEYNLFISVFFWEDNPQKEQLLSILNEYFNDMLL